MRLNLSRIAFIPSFSKQLVISFVLLIILTTMSAGVPAFWLTRAQLQLQAWSQLENAHSATLSLLEAEQNRLANQLNLFTARPTLRQLAQETGGDALETYLQNFQSQSNLDILLFCATADPDFAACLPPAQSGFVMFNGRPALIRQQVVTAVSSDQPLGVAAVGTWLEEPFLGLLYQATGLPQSVLQEDGVRLASTFAPVGSLSTIAREGVVPAAQQSLVVNDQLYYVSYIPLRDDTGQITLLSEVAFSVGALVTTERRAFLILAISTLSVVLLGSAFTVWYVRQINAPLKRLTATAERISQGDLVTPVPVINTPTEIQTLSLAFQRSQAMMLEAMQERSEVGQRLNALLQSLVEGVVTYDTAVRVTFWNEGAYYLLGWTPAEANGRHINDLFPLAETPHVKFIEQVPPPGQKKQLTVLTRTGQPMVLAITGSRLIPPSGNTVQVALVFRDVTQEASLRQSRSYFLANISHEFRTPLSTLNASMELLLDEQETFSLDEVRQLLKPTHVSLLSLQTLIDNLLESSSIEAGHFILRRRSLHVHEPLENALNIARPLLERRQQPLAVTEPPYLAPLLGDPTRLTQVFVNLIINASKYSPIGQPLEIQLVQHPQKLWVGVLDRGPGIPPEERHNLFQSFVRLGTGDQEQYGIGLGLSVVKTIVEAHSGQVGVTERTGGGSLFWFEIPLFHAT